MYQIMLSYETEKVKSLNFCREPDMFMYPFSQTDKIK